VNGRPAYYRSIILPIIPAMLLLGSVYAYSRFGFQDIPYWVALASIALYGAKVSCICQFCGDVMNVKYIHIKEALSLFWLRFDECSHIRITQHLGLC